MADRGLPLKTRVDCRWFEAVHEAEEEGAGARGTDVAPGPRRGNGVPSE